MVIEFLTECSDNLKVLDCDMNNFLHESLLELIQNGI